jgi:hypothetical protein
MSEPSNPVQSYDDFAPSSKKKTDFRVLTKLRFFTIQKRYKSYMLHGGRFPENRKNRERFGPLPASSK